MTPGSQECPHGVETDGYRGVHRGDIWGVRHLAIRSQKRKKKSEQRAEAQTLGIYSVRPTGGGFAEYRDKRKERASSRLSRTHILVTLGSSLASINHMSIVCVSGAFWGKCPI